MDPEATLQLLIEAACDGDARALVEHAEDLATWLLKGGYRPSRLKTCSHGYQSEWYRYCDLGGKKR